MWRGGGWPCKRTWEHVWPLNLIQKEILFTGKMIKRNIEIYTKIIPPWKQYQSTLVSPSIHLPCFASCLPTGVLGVVYESWFTEWGYFMWQYACMSNCIFIFYFFSPFVLKNGVKQTAYCKTQGWSIESVFFRNLERDDQFDPLSKFGVVWIARTPSNRVEQIDIVWDYMASPWAIVKSIVSYSNTDIFGTRM
jgi:hypothetical protein